MGTTVSRGRVAFKPAFVNWRTTSRELALVLPTIRELGNELVGRDQAQIHTLP